MDKEEEFQLQEKIMFPKCSLSNIIFQKKTPEKRRKWTRRKSSSSRRRSCSPVPRVPNPLLCSRRRHQRKGGNGRGGRVPVPGEDHVPQSQEFLIHYYVPEEDNREEFEEKEFPFQK